jgi:cytochrome c553
VQSGAPLVQQASVTAGPHPVSQVSWETAVLAMLRNANAGHGEQIAARCAACHGTHGLAPNVLFPNLAGQTVFAIYKQLQDYRSGARLNDGMQAVVRYLDDQTMADVAAYYASHAASQPRPAGNDAITNLAVRGDPSRSIAACDECHVNRPEAPMEAPYLIGQHDQYLASQLQAFARQSRNNDVYARMRAIAASLTGDEIAGLAAYYSVTKSQ